jgi:hypothetical protein
LRRAAPADPVVAPNVFLICQSKSEHIIRDDEIADVDGRTLTDGALWFTENPLTKSAA